jgi:two-component system response regulator PilR (NtrC family)
MSTRVIIADDERALRESMAEFLTEEGFECFIAENASKALELLHDGGADILVSDIRMPGMDGIALMEQVRLWSPETLIVLMTAFASIETAVQALRQGATDYLIKPIDYTDLSSRLKNLAEKQHLIRENRYLKEQVERRFNFNFIIGDSPAMKQVYKLISRVAETQSTVLVTGPSGSGKELVARAVHQHSPRKKAPFIAINCGAIPDALFESELFGHKKGSFTGALADRDGYFLLADGGTLFLDEVGELPHPMQVKLLRVLQDGEVRPVGAVTSRKVDVRIIAATNRDLEAEVDAGRFRRDLFYRLNVLHIHVPGLNDRKEDIPLLAQFFLEKFTKELGKTVHGISSSAMRQLINHTWKGQVRELENVMERAVLLTDTEMLQPEDLPFYKEEDSMQPAVDFHETGLNEALATFERDYISHVLKRCGGSRTEAARVLGVDPSTLYRKMEKHQLSGEETAS